MGTFFDEAANIATIGEIWAPRRAHELEWKVKVPPSSTKYCPLVPLDTTGCVILGELSTNRNVSRNGLRGS